MKIPPFVVRNLPRIYRLAVLAAAAWLLRGAMLRNELPAPPSVSVADARVFLPNAAQFSQRNSPRGGWSVLDPDGQLLGFVVTTSPETDDLLGYAGPNNALVVLDREQRVVGVSLLSSGDTQAHVDAVRRNDSFWSRFSGWKPATEPSPRVDAVSGSTLTSLALAEAVTRRLQGAVPSLRFPDPVTLDEIRTLFPAARRFSSDDPRAGWNRVWSAGGETLGYAVRTAPFSDNGRGYRGPTESLVAVAADGVTVINVQLRRSYDTGEYVQRVRDDESYRRSLAGRTTDDWARIDFSREGLEGVSGATQTSFAVAEGLRRRFTADRAAARHEVEASDRRRPTATLGLIAVIVVALALTFTPLRAHRRLRILWQGLLIIAFASWLGDLISLALLVSWARHGVPWGAAPIVVLLVAVALLVPWATRRQIYCRQICPHGAAQEWLGRFKRLHAPLPPHWTRRLSHLPAALLIAGVAAAALTTSFDLAWLEPFDAWVLKGAAMVSAIVAVAGLVASVFVPQAYCRFGCPTGELLQFVRSGGIRERFQRRDAIAGVLVVLGILGVGPTRLFSLRDAGPRPTSADVTNSPRLAAAEWRGRAFGTTWSVKFRGPVAADALRKRTAAELERIESQLSHWRVESYTSQFNASETTLETEQTSELVTLVAQALDISRQTGGAYDITVGPLVDAWGFGPSGPRESSPSDAEIARLLDRTGWNKLVADSAHNSLRKAHPQLQIDLGSLLQGYAADRVALQLKEAGIEEFLIDVGGELLARGAWTVAIENPQDPSTPLRTLRLENAALATSGVYRARRREGPNAVHHLISPRTGRPYSAPAKLCAVIAPTAQAADAWATALLAVGPAEGLKLAAERHLTVFFVDE